MADDKRQVYLDIEANKLIRPTKIWCIVCTDLATGEQFKFRPKTPFSGHKDFKDDFIKFSKTVSLFIGHNILGYDAPNINRLFDCEILTVHNCLDTLVLSRLFRPVPPQREIKGVYNRQWGHSLAAWGRYLNFPKGDFHDFEKFSEPMLEYCVRDNDLGILIYQELMKEKVGFSEECIELEHHIAHMLFQQTENGFYLDQTKALKLKEETGKLLEDYNDKLQTLFPPVWRLVRNYHLKHNKDGSLGKVSARIIDTYSTKEGLKAVKKDDGSYDLMTQEIFNPQSGDQIAERLQALGWEPKYFTEKGNVKTDKVTLQEAIYTLLEGSKNNPAIRCLADYSIVANRHETASTWLELANDKESYNDGRVHGKIISIGAGTHRMSHHCVPMSSTILTRSGWKTYDEAIVGEDVMAYDMEAKVKCWTPLLAKHKFENAEIGSIGQKNGRKRLYCTRNHRWVVGTSRNKGRKKERLVEAGNIGKHAAILINAPFKNDVTKADFKLINEKYAKDWTSEICKLSDVELNAMMQGFLLADGCLKNNKVWQFAQSEGNLCEAFLTVLYLITDKRVSACQKTKLKGPNQRWGFNVTTTQNQYMRTQDMSWRFEYTGDVWCPTTKFSTWVMKQDDFISITGNSPNMANIARVQLDKENKPIAGLKGAFGWDCRDCFTVEGDNILVGADAAGIQLRALAHYMNDPDYTEALLKSDIHIVHQKAAGISTRARSKTFIYSWLMGGGDEKIGSIVGVKESEYDELFYWAKHKKQWDKNLFERTMVSLREKKRKADKKTVATIVKGFKTKEQFLDRTPALKHLKKEIIPATAKQGYLIGLDGRKIWVPNAHLGMSIFLQGFEAVIMKYAMKYYQEKLNEERIFFKQCATIHDEFQVETKKEYAQHVGQTIVDGIRIAGTHFRTNCPLDGEYKIGRSWAECH